MMCWDDFSRLDFYHPDILWPYRNASRHQGAKMSTLISQKQFRVDSEHTEAKVMKWILTMCPCRWAREGRLNRLWMKSGELAWPSHRNMDWPFSSRKMPESVRRSSEQRTGVAGFSLLTSMLCWKTVQRVYQVKLIVNSSSKKKRLSKMIKRKVFLFPTRGMRRG